MHNKFVPFRSFVHKLVWVGDPKSKWHIARSPKCTKDDDITIFVTTHFVNRNGNLLWCWMLKFTNFVSILITGRPRIEHNKIKGQNFPYICPLQWCLNKKIQKSKKIKNQKSKMISSMLAKFSMKPLYNTKANNNS
jgi:hypothetical protein